MIRLLLADDEDLIRGALVSLLDLEADLQVVAQADTTTESIAQARRHRPDIAVLDLEMPPADGLQAAETIRAELPTQIVLVTRHARPGILRRALAAGVAGFVPKTTPADRLADILRNVAEGAATSTPTSPPPLSPNPAARSPAASSTSCEPRAPATRSEPSPSTSTSHQAPCATTSPRP